MHSCLQTKKPYVYACKHANHVGPSARKQTKIWYKFYFLGYKTCTREIYIVKNDQALTDKSPETRNSWNIRFECLWVSTEI